MKKTKQKKKCSMNGRTSLVGYVGRDIFFFFVEVLENYPKFLQNVTKIQFLAKIF